MRAHRSSHAMVHCQGALYAIGGFDGMEPLRSVEILDLATAGPSFGAGFPTAWAWAAPLADPRHRLAAAAWRDRVFAIGGGSGRALATAEVLDTARGAWLSAPELSVARFGHAAVTLGCGRVLVAGGINFDRVSRARPTQAVEAIDPREPDRVGWTQLPPLAKPRGGLAAAACGPGDLDAIVAGGHDGLGVLSSTEIFDGRKREWRPGPGLQLPRNAPCAAGVGASSLPWRHGRDVAVAVAGGADGVAVHRSIELARLSTSGDVHHAAAGEGQFGLALGSNHADALSLLHPRQWGAAVIVAPVDYLQPEGRG